VKNAAFGRMLIRPHLEMKRSLNIADGGVHVQNHSIGMRRRHGETILLRILTNRLVIFLRRAESRSEFFGGQITVIICARRIVDFLQQVLQFILVSQWQTDGKLQMFRTIFAAQRRQSRHCLGDMTAQRLGGRILGPRRRNCRKGNNYCPREGNYESNELFGLAKRIHANLRLKKCSNTPPGIISRNVAILRRKSSRTRANCRQNPANQQVRRTTQQDDQPGQQSQNNLRQNGGF
jgi:hypothetical protein